MNNTSIITTDYSSEEYSSSLFNFKNMVLIPILLLVILITIMGNLLVIISVLIEKSLRTPSNCLIFSLAIIDLIVGAVVMPLRGSVALFGYWPFGFRCDLPLELNIMTCQTSVFHLVAIAIDRYIIMSKIQTPNTLLSTRSIARIALMLTIVWSTPAMFVALPFLGWHDKGWEVRNKQFRCIGNWVVGYRALGLIITYYIPVTIIIVFYLLIYQIACESARHKRKHTVQQLPMSGRQSQVDWEPDYSSQVGHHQTACGQTIMCVQNMSIIRKLMHNKEDREKKVAKTLTIITSVFLFFWSPYFITFTVFIKDETIPYLLNETVLWFGLTNSALNPLIYAYFVPTFRLTFKKIIKFRK